MVGNEVSECDHLSLQIQPFLSWPGVAACSLWQLWWHSRRGTSLSPAADCKANNVSVWVWVGKNDGGRGGHGTNVCSHLLSVSSRLCEACSGTLLWRLPGELLFSEGPDPQTVLHHLLTVAQVGGRMWSTQAELSLPLILSLSLSLFPTTHATVVWREVCSQR